MGRVCGNILDIIGRKVPINLRSLNKSVYIYMCVCVRIHRIIIIPISMSFSTFLSICSCISGAISLSS